MSGLILLIFATVIVLADEYSAEEGRGAQPVSFLLLLVLWLLSLASLFLPVSVS